MIHCVDLECQYVKPLGKVPAMMYIVFVSSHATWFPVIIGDNRSDNLRLQSTNKHFAASRHVL